MIKQLIILLLFATKLLGQDTCRKYYRVGIDNIEMLEYHLAIENLNKYVACNPYSKSLECSYYLGIAHLNSIDTAKALYYFNRVLNDTGNYEDQYLLKETYEKLIKISDARKEFEKSITLFHSKELIKNNFVCNRNPYGSSFRNKIELSKKYENAGYTDSSFITIAKYIFGNSYSDYFYQDTDTTRYRDEVTRIYNILVSRYPKEQIKNELKNFKLTVEHHGEKNNKKAKYNNYQLYDITIFNTTFLYDLFYLKPKKYSKRNIRREFRKSDLYGKLKEYVF